MIVVQIVNEFHFVIEKCLILHNVLSVVATI